MSIESYIAKFSPMPAGEDHLRCSCPLCTDKANRFYVRVKDSGRRRRGACCCFNCNYKANDFVRFISAVEGCSYAEAEGILGGDMCIPRPNQLFSLLAAEEEPEQRLPWTIPEEFRKIAFPGTAEYDKSSYARKAYLYLRGRGLSRKEIEHFGIRYCRSAGRYFGMLIIPVFEDGKPVYFCTRAYTESYTKKTINPTLEEVGGVGKAGVVFGLDRAAGKSFCVVTEGPFDAMTLGDYGVAILGKAMSQAQQDKILGCRFRRIYIMLDADARDAAYDLWGRLARWVPSAVVPMLDEEKDVNNIGAKAAWDKIRTTPFRSYMANALRSLAGISV